MTSQRYDIIVLGATGYTGRLITRYLFSHRQFREGHFTFAIAGRSNSKLQELVQELSLSPNIGIIGVDVTVDKQVESTVKLSRVIINAVGPYWRWGTPVVRACARNGIHYVDLTGESVWIKDIIQEFDYLATKTGAVIVPSCGMDSIPSDVSAFISNKALKSYGQYDVGTSVTAINMRGKISGGTLSTIMAMIEEVPTSKRSQSEIDYSLSPARGGTHPAFRLLYSLGIPKEMPIFGTFFGMQPSNRKLVQRTFGLLELQAQNVAKLASPSSASEAFKVAQQERYGPAFAYDEFLAMPSRITSIFFSVAFGIGIAMLAFVTPFRWVVKLNMPQPGSGPSDEDLNKGFLEFTNHTTSSTNPSIHVKSVFKGNGDPGYYLSSIMISESALSLILPLTSTVPRSSSSIPPFTKSTSLPAGLPSLAYQGGVLTPMSAFGDILIARLKESGKFSFESNIIIEDHAVEGRKDI